MLLFISTSTMQLTLSIFCSALDCGTEMLEIDLHLTSDAVVVVSHDNHLLRATGHDAYVSDMSYDELPRLREVLKPDFCPGDLCIFVEF